MSVIKNDPKIIIWSPQDDDHQEIGSTLARAKSRHIKQIQEIAADYNLPEINLRMGSLNTDPATDDMVIMADINTGRINHSYDAKLDIGQKIQDTIASPVSVVVGSIPMVGIPDTVEQASKRPEYKYSSGTKTQQLIHDSRSPNLDLDVAKSTGRMH